MSNKNQLRKWKRVLACDVDGTLIREADSELNQSLFDAIKKLNEKDYLFVPITGRDYSGVRKLFDPVHELIYYICGNGAQIIKNDEVLYEDNMDLSLVIEIVKDISKTSLPFFVSGRDTTFILNSHKEFEQTVKDYSTNIKLIQNLEEIDEPIIKVSVYSENNALEAYNLFKEKWSYNCHLVVSGDSWVDFSLADKGTGLSHLCEMLDISFEHTWGFGDQYNDLPMLSIVGNPYIMSFSYPELHKKEFQLADSVEDVLETML